MKMEIVFWKSLKWYIRKVISNLSGKQIILHTSVDDHKTVVYELEISMAAVNLRMDFTNVLRESDYEFCVLLLY